MLVLNNNKYECLTCGEQIIRTVYADRPAIPPNPSGEEWSCPNGHDVSEVRVLPC